MKKLVLAASVAGSLLLTGAPDVFGHGGVYRGPGDSVPPGSGGGPGTPGPSTGGPTTPGPGGPSTPGGGRGPTTPGGGPSIPGGGGGARGPTTARGGKKHGGGGEGYEAWQFWWEYNKERYLDLRERLGSTGQTSGSIQFFTGQGVKNRTTESKRPTASEVKANIVPILISVLKEDDADIVDSAVLALGRTVRADSSGLVIDEIKSTLKNTNISVKQSAILSLGVLGSKDALPTLIEIMKDSPEGRKILDERNSIQDLQRGFAAISLGLIGSPEAIQPLMDIVTKEDDSETNLRSAAITGLGLFKEQKEEIVKFLLDQLKDNKMERTTRAQIPVALGRLGAEAAIPELLGIIKSRRSTDIRLEESCVIGLGLLAQPGDEQVASALQEMIEESNNEQGRHFSFIALSQMAAKAAGDMDRYGDFIDNLVNKFLLKELTKPKKKTHQPWAGISVALIARELPAESNLRSTIITKLLETFNDSNNPSYKSAFAVGLGLVEAIGAGPEIAEEMSKTHDTGLKGYLALSLGMMRFTEALPDLRKDVLDNRDPKMRLQIATALGLMGDVEALDTLLESLKGASTLNVISSLAKAIGLIGDRRALQPLQELIGDEKAPGLARGFGCVAIGLIGEKTSLPWNNTLTENANYRTVLPVLYEIADIL